MTNLFILLMLLFFCSCAVDIDYKIQATRFETPEAVGKTLGGRVYLNYAKAHKITLAEVFGGFIFNETVDTVARFEKSSGMGLGASLGLLSRLDLIYRSISDSPTQAGLKFQFLGEPEIAKSNGLKASVSAAYGTMDKSEGGLTVTKSDDSETREYDTNLEIVSYDLSLNLGYRFTKNVIIYFNNFYSYYGTEAKLTSTTNPDVTINGISRSYGTLVGIRFTKSHFFASVEGGVSKAEWENSLEQTIYPVGLQMGVGW